MIFFDRLIENENYKKKRRNISEKTENKIH